MNFKESPEEKAAIALGKRIYDNFMKEFLDVLNIEDLYERYTLTQDFVNRHLLPLFIGNRLTLDVCIIPIPLNCISSYCTDKPDITSPEKLVKVAYTCTGPTPPLTLDEDGMAHIDFGDDIKLVLNQHTDELPLFLFDYKHEGDILRDDCASFSFSWTLMYKDHKPMQLICMTPVSLRLNQLGSRYKEYGKFEDVLAFLEHQSNLIDNQYRIVPIHNTFSDKGEDIDDTD